MASFSDRRAAQDAAAARARIEAIYTNRGLPAPPNIDRQIARIIDPNTSDYRGADYFDQIRQHADRESTTGFIGGAEQPNFTSPGQPSPGTQPTTDDDLYPDEGPDFDAKARLEQLLAAYGLGGLGDWAWNMLLDGHSETTILQELRKRPEYRARFPAIDELRQRGRAISEGEYIGLERSYVQISRAYGLPETFYDQPEDFAGFIANEMAPTEFEDRLQLWRQVADDRAADPANATVLDELGRLYGITPDSGEWLALVVDSDRALPTLERQARAARVGREALNTGFGRLSVGEAERVGAVASPEAAREGFGALAQSRQLFAPLPGREQSEQTVSRDDQLGAAFDSDQQALEQIRRQRERRTAEFAGGGGFASGRDGLALGRGR